MTNNKKFYLAILLGILNIEAPTAQSEAVEAVSALMQLARPGGSLVRPGVLIDTLKLVLENATAEDKKTVLGMLNLQALKDAGAMGRADLATLEALVMSVSRNAGASVPVTEPAPQPSAAPATMLSEAALAYLKTVTPEFNRKVDEAAEKEIAQAFNISRVALNIRKLGFLGETSTVTPSMLMDFMDAMFSQAYKLSIREKVEAWSMLSPQLLEKGEKGHYSMTALREFKIYLFHDIASVTNDQLNTIVAEHSQKMFELSKAEQTHRV